MPCDGDGEIQTGGRGASMCGRENVGSISFGCKSPDPALEPPICTVKEASFLTGNFCLVGAGVELEKDRRHMAHTHTHPHTCTMDERMGSAGCIGHGAGKARGVRLALFAKLPPLPFPSSAPHIRETDSWTTCSFIHSIHSQITCIRTCGLAPRSK